MLGIISNSRGGSEPKTKDGAACSLLTLSRSLVPHTLSVMPSPGTRSVNFMGTRDVLVKVQVFVLRKPGLTRKINNAGVKEL